MAVQLAPDRLVVAVRSRKELDAALDKVVDLLKPGAMTKGIGISVTRLAPGRYEACLNINVPAGTTKESWGTCDESR